MTPPLDQDAVGGVFGDMTKIVATIGPASCTPDVVARLVESGATVFRINFSHGSARDHAASVAAIREVERDTGRPLAVFGDLPGPKIRLGEVAGDGLQLDAGTHVIFQRASIVATGDRHPIRLSCGYAGLVDDAVPGQRLLINDGAVRMLVVKKRADELECTVTQGGVVSTGKGLNLPETHLAIPAIGAADMQFVAWAVEHELDAVAMSFVRRSTDIAELATVIRDCATRSGRDDLTLPIIAKIEHPSAVESIDEIVAIADGVMIARGDLGVEMDLARVPVIQRQITDTARRHRKPCIVATQMLESMIHNPQPTRAEANDVAGAIFDCVDAVMLSGETAIGAYPALAVEHVRRIARYTEAHLAAYPVQRRRHELTTSSYRTAALAHGVRTVSDDLGARLIAIWSQAGGGARYLSQHDLRVPLVAATSDERAARRMQLLRGVVPIVMTPPPDLATFSRLIDQRLVVAGWASPGDTCVLVAGQPLGTAGVTNSLAILTIGDPDSGF